jgi:hypothetical protein
MLFVFLFNPWRVVVHVWNLIIEVPLWSTTFNVRLWHQSIIWQILLAFDKEHVALLNQCLLLVLQIITHEINSYRCNWGNHGTHFPLFIISFVSKWTGCLHVHYMEKVHLVWLIFHRYWSKVCVGLLINPIHPNGTYMSCLWLHTSLIKLGPQSSDNWSWGQIVQREPLGEDPK